MKKRKNPNQFEFEGESSGDNLLWEYVQSMNPEIIEKLSQPTPEVAQLMEHNLAAMLGNLPPEHFDVKITTSREALGQMLGSAMMSGYFLNKAKQRMDLEKSVHQPNSHG